MTREALLAYLGVVAMITVTPGPDTAIVLRNAARHGWSAGVRTGVGSALGLLIWGLAAGLGIAVILAASAFAFTVLKLAGAAYLGYLGIRMLWQAWQRHPGSAIVSATEPHAAVSARVLFRQGLITNLLNPKAAAFFTALLPQFVTGHGMAAAPLVVGLALIAAVANLSGQCVFAVAAHRTARLIGRRYFEPIMDGVVGVVLLTLGGKLALGNRT
ncbi:LysE family translocator [Streptosporangium sp. 'caverna']|uniref:LysE family translocator n=1 Tax=Streptosporangium sp. 'caverna' TaxID=2202249 RepID=UPI000D7DDE2E|nr:LysE family translocator [Streptosporangium sp. 'caverna']AWS45219.1 LysE family translocator [Streptosporangium sp. 'caverna']